MQIFEAHTPPGHQLRVAARDLLIHWDLEIGKFWQIVPFEMIDRLAQPLSDQAAQAIA